MGVANANVEVVFFNHKIVAVLVGNGWPANGRRFGVSICKGQKNKFDGGICNNCKYLCRQPSLPAGIGQKESIVLEMDKQSGGEFSLIRFQGNHLNFED